MNEIHFIVSKKEGKYDVGFEFGDQPKWKEVIARAAGAEIVYKGNLSMYYQPWKGSWEEIMDKKIDLIKDFVEHATREGKFDSKTLEEKLAE